MSLALLQHGFFIFSQVIYNGEEIDLIEAWVVMA